MNDGAMIVNVGTGIGEISQDMLKIGTCERNRATVSITSDGDGCMTCSFEKMSMRKKIKIVCSTTLNLGCSNGTTDEIIDIVFSTALVTMIDVDGASLLHAICPVDSDIEKQAATAWLSSKYDVRPVYIREKDLVSENRLWGDLFRFIPANNVPTLTRFSTVRASFNPSTTTDGHYHAVSEEAYLVESGSADIQVWNPQKPDEYNKLYNVGPSDYLAIPRGMAHRVFAGPDARFVCVVIASPPFSFWDQFFPDRPAVLPNQSTSFKYKSV